MVRFARDTNAPKRPLGVYFRFVADARPQVLEQYPALKSDIGAFGKYVGQLWKACSEEDRARYQQAANADRAKYTDAMNAYRQTEGYAAYQTARKAFNKNNKVARQLKQLKKTLVNQPKRPVGSYMQFAATIRTQLSEANPTWGVAAIGKAIGAAWGELTDEQKQPFQAKYQAGKVVYQRELAAYRESKEWATYVAAKKNVRGAVKEAERAKKQKQKAKDQAKALAEKARAKKAAAKAKLAALKAAAKAKRDAQRAKALAKKEAIKAKRVAKKEKEAARKQAKKEKVQAKRLAKKERKRVQKEKLVARKAALKAKVLAQRARTHAIALRKREAEKAKKLRQRLREKVQKQRVRVLAAKK